MYKMNHWSEWMKFFDEDTGRYRFRHKGYGVIRDSLMAIGKAFKKGMRRVTKKTAKAAAESASQKLGEMAAEKEGAKIQQLLRKRRTQTSPKVEIQNSRPASDAMINLSRILANQL